MYTPETLHMLSIHSNLLVNILHVSYNLSKQPFLQKLYDFQSSVLPLYNCIIFMFLLFMRFYVGVLQRDENGLHGTVVGTYHAFTRCACKIIQRMCLLHKFRSNSYKGKLHISHVLDFICTTYFFFNPKGVGLTMFWAYPNDGPFKIQMISNHLLCHCIST